MTKRTVAGNREFVANDPLALILGKSGINSLSCYLFQYGSYLRRAHRTATVASRQIAVMSVMMVNEVEQIADKGCTRGATQWLDVSRAD